MPYIYVQMADRFSLAPWVVEDAPADRFQFYLGILAEEGRIKGDLAGLEPDEEMFWEDDEEGAG